MGRLMGLIVGLLVAALAAPAGAGELPAPREWTDLARPEYYGHLVISAPSRSGTTHLTVEVILQAYGWEKG